MPPNLHLLIAAIARRRINPNLEARIHTVAFFMLLILIAILTYSDIRKLIYS